MIQAEKNPRENGDFFLFILLMIIVASGLIFNFMITWRFAYQRYQVSHFHFFYKQSVIAVVGIVLAFIIYHLPLNYIKKMKYPLLFFSLILPLLPFVPGLGISENGATRWIGIEALNLTFQPSELLKFTLILYLAIYFEDKRGQLNKFATSVLPPILLTITIAGVIYMQKDFSTTFTIVITSGLIFIVAGVPLIFILALAVVSIAVFYSMIISSSYILNRIQAFLYSDVYRDVAFQAQKAEHALRSGGFWGVGIDNEFASLRQVPELLSDYIFTAFSIEVGFVGVFLFMILFLLFWLRSLYLAGKSDDNFIRCCAAAISSIILMQVLFNLAVVSNIVPTSGIPLPFYSAGGSSLLTNLLMAGVLMNISRYVSEGEK